MKTNVANRELLQDSPDGNQVINTALMWWPFVYPICQKSSNPRCLKPPYLSWYLQVISNRHGVRRWASDVLDIPVRTDMDVYAVHAILLPKMNDFRTLKAWKDSTTVNST